MKAHIVLTAIIAAALFQPQTQAANKCTIDGKTIYQDAPCASGGTSINTTANGPVAPDRRTMSREEIRQADRPKAQKIDHQAITLGMATGQPVVGMTSNQLSIAMGNPNRRNTGDYGNIRRDQLIYERGSVTFYVYVEDGVVESVQTSEGYRRSAQSSRRCPTSIEIRNMQTTANSDSIGESQRRALLNDIRDAKNCN